jgi:hypothetical protein
MLQDKLEESPKDNTIDIENTINEEEVQDLDVAAQENDPIEQGDDWLEE